MAACCSLLRYVNIVIKAIIIIIIIIIRITVNSQINLVVTVFMEENVVDWLIVILLDKQQPTGLSQRTSSLSTHNKHDDDDDDINYTEYRVGLQHDDDVNYRVAY